MPNLMNKLARPVMLQYRSGTAPGTNAPSVRKIMLAPGIPKSVSEQDMAEIRKIRLFQRLAEQGEIVVSGERRAKLPEIAPPPALTQEVPPPVQETQAETEPEQERPRKRKRERQEFERLTE
jgi:hypothetical protein